MPKTAQDEAEPLAREKLTGFAARLTAIPFLSARLTLIPFRLSGFANLAYPPCCLACKDAVDEAGALCPGCWVRMPFIERPFCERLGTPFAQDLGAGLLSPAAQADPPVFARARVVATYDDGPARVLVQRLKYADRLDLAPAMARWMARAGAELIAEADCVIPVPLHRFRLWTRRFNQAALLAKGVARHAGLPYAPMALTRVKRTRPQVGLTRDARAANMQGAFKVPAEATHRVAGARILLVDDVLTSGATLNAAARVLLRAGAARVDVLTFARVVTGG
jgi:ComF family protein